MATIDYALEGVAEHKVQSNMEFNLIVTKGGEKCDSSQEVVAVLKGLHEEIRGKITKSFGNVRINFHVGTPGAYELNIHVNKKLMFQTIVKVVESHGKHYEDFRFEITSEVFNGGRVGSPYVINIAARKNGELKDVDESLLYGRIGKGNELQTIQATKTGHGTYVVKFSVPVPGFHAIDIWYEGRSVIAQPERVHFISGSDAKQTKAVQVPQKMETVGQVTTFQIQSRNSAGLNNTSGGDNFDIACEGPSQLVDLVIRDTLDGKYSVSFTPLATGTYTLNVSLNGTPIGNSPVKITAIRK